MTQTLSTPLAQDGTACGEVEPAAPAVAVLMSVYARDQPAWLRAAFESILLQAYPRERIRIYLAVDGPVPGPLREVIEQYRGECRRVVDLPRNGGLSAALNTLMRRLGNERYVFRMDADDVCHRDRFARQVDYMEQHPQVGILGSAIREFEDAPVSSSAMAECNVRRYPRAAQVRESIARTCPLAHPTVCFRRTALNSLGGYPANRESQDIAMWFRAVEHGIVIDNLPEPLLQFRLTPGTLARRGLKKAFGEFWVYVRGSCRLHGPSARLVYPMARLLLRLTPAPVVRLAYGRRDWRDRLGSGH